MTAEQLLRNADAAMYAAKADDVRHVAAYEAETHAATRRRRELSLQLDGAIGQHEIELRFQPVVALDGGVIEAFESLVRWSHPTYGVMSPGDFLPVADNRQLRALGKRVMWEACRHACLWQNVGEPGRRIGVWINLSAVDLTSDSLVDDMTQNVTRAQLDPTLVTLEITEHSVIVGEQAAVENVTALRKVGMHVAIDDFGTGYSSLSRLGEFPLDMLKIPMPFVDRLSDEKADRRLVDAIIRLAESLDLGVVAEGVEREVQARVLAALGCRLAQGYCMHHRSTATTSCGCCNPASACRRRTASARRRSRSAAPSGLRLRIGRVSANRLGVRGGTQCGPPQLRSYG